MHSEHSERWPSEFCLENVRCFPELQTARIRRLTFLVGENSTGKTTFLGCYSVLHRMMHHFHRGFHFRDVDFSEPPFDMGSFEDIVRNESKDGAASECFSLKLAYSDLDEPKREICAIFGNSGGQPMLNTIKLELEHSFIEFTAATTNSFTINLDGEAHRFKGPLSVATVLWLDLGLLAEELDGVKVGNEWWERVKEFHAHWFKIDRVNELVFRKQLNLYPLAPLRASPKRTYNPGKENGSPEGTHIPRRLNRLAQTEPGSWNALREHLKLFGKDSGMFSNLDVKTYEEGSPFHLQVQVNSTTPVNLADVGYGVSQCLPILIDVCSAEDTQFILQQPEVHLHPRAQAELATFLVKSVRDSQNRFMIETHSDYILDRIRVNVRQGLLSADNVSILYFESRENAVRVHNLWLDEYGNLEGAPPGYREFFARETDRVLGFED